MVPEILRGSLKTPGPLSSKKSLDRIGLTQERQHALTHGRGITTAIKKFSEKFV